MLIGDEPRTRHLIFHHKTEAMRYLACREPWLTSLG